LEFRLQPCHLAPDALPWPDERLKEQPHLFCRPERQADLDLAMCLPSRRPT
jgi:hypothetical protein